MLPRTTSLFQTGRAASVTVRLDPPDQIIEEGDGGKIEEYGGIGVLDSSFSSKLCPRDSFGRGAHWSLGKAIGVTPHVRSTGVLCKLEEDSSSSRCRMYSWQCSVLKIGQDSDPDQGEQAN
jgi:hypothetical protein